MQNIQVKNEDTPIEILAEAIVQVAKGAKTLLESRLNEDALVLLIQKSIKPATQAPTLDQIRLVLRHAAKLDKTYLKPPTVEKK